MTSPNRPAPGNAERRGVVTTEYTEGAPDWRQLSVYSVYSVVNPPLGCGPAALGLSWSTPEESSKKLCNHQSPRPLFRAQFPIPIRDIRSPRRSLGVGRWLTIPLGYGST